MPSSAGPDLTVAGLTDERGRARSTVGELTLGGLVKHLAATRLSRLSVIDGTAAPEADWADTLRVPRTTRAGNHASVLDCFLVRCHAPGHHTRSRGERTCPLS
ncbi:hypothetical protein AMK17_06740 [Streptomyces sp. CB00072]|uniref:DUF664 domain-containing protein n=1 Tax=Streptomyces sp. CB00072 TaxID=1703928 RepID=UPI000940570E|nr:DUF664 domain-containing protein [Streptomyces sp. CB00072]OKI59599.1 hypothetical protein AMK17_06740 [Streptomyces sp. CB00072]